MGKIIDAVAAVFVYNNKIFLIKRQGHLRAFPGYHAFPGGKIDSNESTSVFNISLLDKYPVRPMRALCREIEEELGYDIELAVASGEIVDISQIAVTTAPPYLPQRFRIYYYKIELAKLPGFVPMSGEIHTSLWCSPSKVLDEFNKGNMLMVPATKKLIAGLGEDIDVRHINNVGLKFDDDNEVPCIEFIKDCFQLLPLSSTLPPAERTNVLVFGDEGEKRFLVDPSPRDLNEMEKFLTTIFKFKVTDILVTHHHVDHTEYLQEIVERLNVPVYMSPYSFNMLKKKHGDNFLNRREIHLLKEGDVLTKWLGRNVTVYDMPGHCEGHLALAPEGMEWFFVGDLFHGLGAVVVDDMIKYFTSLERIIKMNPKYILPSHGMALGGTYVLEKILEHRLFREEQVYDLYKKGKNPEEMLKIIYVDIPERLAVYARKNIKAHLSKLKFEKRI